MSKIMSSHCFIVITQQYVITKINEEEAIFFDVLI